MVLACRGVYTGRVECLHRHYTEPRIKKIQEGKKMNIWRGSSGRKAFSDSVRTRHESRNRNHGGRRVLGDEDGQFF